MSRYMFSFLIPSVQQRLWPVGSPLLPVFLQQQIALPSGHFPPLPPQSLPHNSNDFEGLQANKWEDVDKRYVEHLFRISHRLQRQ